MASKSSKINAVGLLPPKSIINGFSTNGYGLQTGCAPRGFKWIPGLAAANTLQTIWNYTGQGIISFLSWNTINICTTTVRIKITIDGNVVFDSTSQVTSNPGDGACVIGALNGANMELQPIVFTQSIKIEMATSNAIDNSNMPASYFQIIGIYQIS